ncbi:MAG: 16S rRNA (cytidine(1402)-2'-O)-methyltransferase [Gammaproteobacteria bacterium]|nr:16S rRNA (cytidine(1402)-2'-O)-methyltransferase [Gammaproteobacteria bacterium]
MIEIRKRIGMSVVLNTGKLYVVATPIGHLGDLTRRGEDVLKSVQIIAAEDTRRTRVLLDHIDHRVPQLLSLHEHNEDYVSLKLIDKLKLGADVALVCDAGTPLINDPGFTLIARAHEQGITTIPVPGACSITAALSVCPLPSHPFRFIGFLPAKSKARRELLTRSLITADALVFLEAPHRILQTLEDLAALTPRKLMLAREMTKQYETLLVGTPKQVLEQLGNNPRGEIVVVVEATSQIAVGIDEVKVLEALLKELSPAQAAKIAANICDTSKSLMYDLAIKLGC